MALVERYLAAAPEHQAFVQSIRAAQSEGMRAETPDLARGQTIAARMLGFRPDSVTPEMIGVRQSNPTRMRGMLASDTRPGRLERSPLRQRTAFATRPFLRYAIAGGLVAAILGIVVFLSRRSSGEFTPGRTYATRTGECATVFLADGSRVVLAPQTTLTLDRDFGHTARRAKLVGEAYFAVATRTGAPFMVESGTVSTRVLGTTFDIKHYPTDRDVQILVTTGKVRVAASSQRALPTNTPSAVTLAAGRMVRVSDSTMAVSTVQDTGADTSWVAGRLVFVSTPIPDVLAAVGRWYDFKFQLADSTIADGHLSGKFEHQSERGMLLALASALDVTMSFNRRVVTLHARKPSAAPPSRRDVPFSLRPQMEVGK